ncbi:uncharacterized protein PGTG_09173 [Puccinia graminis f. sp. tritici CRL 75-36-700-3]|uniref:Uncharacterized protein n=1 Tax=Puccinia graminis f. sp. tritici (strain CRL 75-36-700-3 / race SCCL) TaxID=418459 RepID=E3KFT5_PUCGT|nr:uncharacterized protein PGTG_09173 [Puccinia graminis f. sp. tritici CRL 75-36-700-3]EFP83220.2 hypothetical protein PGTG_09173 [Puccinia graminis f. sp. tritici CRL 75-36-700-3]
MFGTTSNVSSRVLCEETQAPESLPLPTTVISKTPQVSLISLDYILYIELSKHFQLSRRQGLSPIKWEKIVPSPRPPPMEANIVALTWPQFQNKAIIHLGNQCGYLRTFLFNNHHAGNLVWLGYIKDHRDYGVDVQIDGVLAFLNFSNAAYDAFPARVAVKITMDNPTQKLYEDAMRAHVRSIS